MEWLKNIRGSFGAASTGFGDFPKKFQREFSDLNAAQRRIARHFISKNIDDFEAQLKAGQISREGLIDPDSLLKSMRSLLEKMKTKEFIAPLLLIGIAIGAFIQKISSREKAEV